MTTTSTDNLHTQIRNQLLTFVPKAGGQTLNQRLGGTGSNDGRLYKSQAPDTVVYPFGVMRLINQLTLGEYGSEREAMDLEIMLFGRPRSQGLTIEDIADLCDQAMLRYVDSSSGLVFSRSRQRDTMPQPVDPADREVVQIRLAYPLKVWPQYLTQWTENYGVFTDAFSEAFA
jgi:hypothetical protein